MIFREIVNIHLTISLFGWGTHSGSSSSNERNNIHSLLNQVNGRATRNRKAEIPCTIQQYTSPLKHRNQRIWIKHYGISHYTHDPFISCMNSTATNITNPINMLYLSIKSGSHMYTHSQLRSLKHSNIDDTIILLPELYRVPISEISRSWLCRWPRESVLKMLLKLQIH